MPGSYFGRLELGGARFTNPVIVPAYDLDVGWAIDAPGRLSALVPASVAPPADGWRGKSVYFEDQLCGPWGGFIDRARDVLDRSVVELVCVGAAQRLAGIRSPRSFQTQSGPAGALARRAISDGMRGGPLTWMSFSTDEGGPWVAQEWRGEPVLAVWRKLARQTNEHWIVEVDESKQVSWRWFRQPREMRHRVLLARGYHFRGRQIDQAALSEIRNDLLVVADGRSFARSHAEIVTNPTSINANERWQGTERVVGATSPGTLRGIGVRRLSLLADPPAQAEIVLSRRNPLCQLIREGDVIRLWAGGSGRYDFTVFSRALSLRGQTLTLTGDAMAVSD